MLNGHLPTKVWYHTPMAARKPKGIADDIVGGIQDIVSPWLGTPPGEARQVTQGKALARGAAETLDQTFAGGMIGAGVKGDKALAKQAAINAAAMGVGYGVVRGASGLVKFARSPTGQIIRNNIGQSDLVGQPIRTAILKAEIRTAIKANMGVNIGIGPFPAVPNTGSTQVRNMMGAFSDEITFFGDVARKYSGMEKLKNSPKTIAGKIQESKIAWQSQNHPTSLYDKIKAEGLSNLPPVYVTSRSSKIRLADGHHRISAANDIDPRQRTRWVVNEYSGSSWDYDKPAFLTPAQKVTEKFVDAAEKFKKLRTGPPVGIPVQSQHSYNLFSSDTIRFLNEVPSPTSKDLAVPFRTSQVPLNVWDQPQNKSLPKKPSSKKR